MSDELRNRRVAVLAADGVEQIELEQTRQATEQAGAQVDLVSVHSGEIQAMNQDINPGHRFNVDRELSQVSSGDYDALLLPGGTINPDTLRGDPRAVEFVRQFVTSGKPRRDLPRPVDARGS